MTEPRPTLPIPAPELARLLSAPQDPRSDGWRLDVLSLEVVGEMEDLHLRLRVDVVPGVGHKPEAWEVTFPFDLHGRTPTDPDEFTRIAIVNTYVNVLRANLEEWWYTKDREPHTAAWGRRLLAP